MGFPTDTIYKPLTLERYEKMKAEIREKWAPKLRALAKERKQQEYLAASIRAFSGVWPKTLDNLYEQRLRQIHKAIQKEIDRLPKPIEKPVSRTPSILRKIPQPVLKYIKDSIGQRGLKITDDTTLQWMGDTLTRPEDRLPSIKGVGTQFRF